MAEALSKDRPIELAGIEDYTEVETLMDRANEYARERSGAYLWHRLDFVRNLMRNNILNEQLYTIRNNDGEITSTIALIEDDERIWGEAGLDGQALYFEKLMKHPEKAQSDEPAQLLAFAADEAIRRGRLYLRCDTVLSMDGLVRYYKNLGFTDKGHFTYNPSGKPGILLETKSDDLRHRLVDADL